MKVYTFFQQNRKTIKEQLGCRYFFVVVAACSCIIQEKYQIGTRIGIN